MSAQASWYWLCIATTVVGCTAKIEGSGGNAADGIGSGANPPGGAGGGPGIAIDGKVCSGAQLLPARIWRLTSKELRASASDLLGSDALPEAELEGEPVVDGFKNNANALSVSTRFAGQLQKAAESWSTLGLSQFARYSSCDGAAFADEACVQVFIRNFGARAFRRALTPEESAGYLEVYRAGVTDDKAPGGVRLVVQSMLQSPNLLYRSELGDASADNSSVAYLSGVEVASALSYSLWGAPPDDALATAAANGALATAAGVSAEARRLLADERARALVSEFASQWLGLQDSSAPLRDPGKFPDFSGIKADAFSEFDLLARAVFLGEGATLGSVFSSASTFVTPKLATFYGLAAGAGSPLQATSLAGSPRTGLLTTAALIASWSRDQDTAPMTRGKRFLERVLCQSLPPPPPSLEVPAVPQLANATTRERYAEHTKNPGCSGCHTTLDGVAFALEHFDSAGRYRALENGKPIDASGQLESGSDADGPFSDLSELAVRLGASQAARACLARQYVRFAVGAGRTGDDDCVVQSLVDAAAKHGDSPKELMVALVSSDFFRARQRQ